MTEVFYNLLSLDYISCSSLMQPLPPPPSIPPSPLLPSSLSPLPPKALGFVGAKIPCAYGPSDGDEGLAKNVQLFKQARESVGPDFPLM